MLKYLFGCQYNDDTEYFQNADDISIKDNRRSCFFDVLTDQVKRFYIREQTHIILNPKMYLVDLTDGHFEVNGISFFAHEISMDKPIINRRLIYKMRNWVDTKGGHKRMWMLGWQGNYLSGENIQRIIMVE